VLDGANPSVITRGEKDLLEENHVNYYSYEDKHVYTKNGVCVDGEWIDTIIETDWLVYDMRERIYALNLGNPTISYTDAGFTLVAGEIAAALDKATEYGIISTYPENGVGKYWIDVPARSEATDDQARQRRMPDIPWEAELAGAINSTKTTGVMRVTLPERAEM
jgi:hypothetical protein